jgi:hypothetical protein
MALLERINSMKQSGMNDSQIINTLSEEGIAPLQINEAFSQLKIKSAVADEMQPSSMSQKAQAVVQPSAVEQNYAAPEQAYANQYAYPQQTEQAYTDQGQYGDNVYYQQAMDIETVKDISKQIVEESMQKIKEELSSLSKMKSEIKFEMQDMENRLVKIETIIQEIQTSIIRKMGQYGEAIQNISSEVRATQDSFSKLINPILDNKRGITSRKEELQENEQDETSQEEPSREEQEKPVKEKQSRGRTSSSGIGVEDYFR